MIQGCRGFTEVDVAEMQRLSDELQSLRAEVDAVRERVDRLPTSYAAISTEEASTFGIAHTTFGSLTVSVESIRPHLDGYMVTLSIGNPLAADFSDGFVKVDWGSKLFDRKERQVALTKPLRAGSYTLVDVSLTPATAEEIRTVNVEVGLEAISLKTR
jgi:hypothetical protein